MPYILYIYDLFHILLSAWHTFGSMECMYTCLLCRTFCSVTFNITVYSSCNFKEVITIKKLKFSHVIKIKHWKRGFGLHPNMTKICALGLNSCGYQT